MSGGESSKDSASKGTPIKAFKRDVRGLLSIQQESPSQSDVTWSSLDSPIKPNRSVGGKSKSLKSSNQLTPKNNIVRKKYYSSPVLVARVPDSSDDKHKNIENQRLLEEFHRQFNSENYVPRNILNNLQENLEDSIVVRDAQINEQNNDIKNDIDKLSDFDYELTDQEDFDVLAKIEEQARQFLIEKETQSSTNKPSTKTDTQIKKPNEPPKSINFKNPKPAPPPAKKGTNDYFDSDDDDLILSIPLEQLTAQNSTSATVSNNKKEQTTNSNNFSHTSVIPTRRENINISSDKNKVQNQSNSKPLVVQSKSDADNITSEPLAKRRCTAEEIAEKRRLALQRRQAHLQSLKLTQKAKN